MVRAISNNENNPAMNHLSTYTPSRATQTLPLVRRIVVDLVDLNQSIDAQREQLKGIDQISETIDEPSYREELSDIRNSLENDLLRLKSCMDELASFGVEVHQPFDGFVDFPAMLNRRPIRLCWQPADETVEYWHELGQHARDRKKWDATKIGC